MDELHDLVMEGALLGVSRRRRAGAPRRVAGAGVRRRGLEVHPAVRGAGLGGAGLLDGRFQVVVVADDVAPEAGPDL